MLSNEFIRSGSISDSDIEGKRGKRAVYFCYHGRIASQKGIDVLADAAAMLLSARKDVRFLLVGQGESALENRLSQLAMDFPGQCVYLQGYDRAVSRLSTAAADFIVLPSKFEPCGLEDFIAQLYGTIPVAHATGGLKKIIHEQTGFLYENNSGENLFAVMNELADLARNDFAKLEKIISCGAEYIQKNYDWSYVIQDKYLPFYREL
jgi:starch synthase